MDRACPKSSARTSRRFVGGAAAAVSATIVFAVMTAASLVAQAPIYTVIHTFTGGEDGDGPDAGLVMDTAGNLYGTTVGGGAFGNGTVFRLRKSGTGWVLNTLHSFAGGCDGAYPESRVSIASGGTLYGTTFNGGGCNHIPGYGTVFQLTPPPTAPDSALAPWNEAVVYRFTGGSDGDNPLGDLIFDQSGNIYGTTLYGGNTDDGVIYELTPSGSGWTETVLYSAQDNSRGVLPCCGVIFDKSGNLYGVFVFGGPGGFGTVFELSPSGSGWSEQTLYGFTGESDGGNPQGGLTFDPSGNLYGTTSNWGDGNGGTVFELTPSNGSWTLSTLYAFFGSGLFSGPEDNLTMDAAGNLYGTTFGDGRGLQGSAFELTPSDGGWAYLDLHDFSGTGGTFPRSTLVFDAEGNLYGTTWLGGSGAGVAFEIAP